MSSMNIEDLIDELGGCGRYQWLTSLVLQVSKTIVAWSMLAMTFNGQQPDFTCADISPRNGSLAVNGNSSIPLSECSPVNVSCDGHVFFTDEINTVVNEWDLVCGRKWIVSMITTIQMAGVLVGCFVCGHLGDMIGRKPTFFTSLVILVAFNIVAYFCVNWQMYAACRFVIGVGIGFYFTVHYNLMTEFMPTQWRPRAIAVPGWALECGVFALIIWLLKDWKNIHLATAAIGVPFLFTFWFMQESFRWLVPRGKFKRATTVINSIAKVNGKDNPDISKIIAKAEDEMRNNSKAKVTYSVLDLFRTAKMTKTTLALCFMWFSISYAYYGLTFGVKSLAGSFYLNVFLMNILEAPVSFCMMFAVNGFGRKFPCMFFFILTGLCGIVVGVIQYVDTPASGTITNVFALGSKITLACAWYVLIVYSTELYPTVVRTISYGLCNTAARVGGMIAPQIVFLNDDIPGLLYFISACVMITSGLLCFLFPETKGRALTDTLEHHEDVEIQVNNEKNGKAISTIYDKVDNDINKNKHHSTTKF